LSYYIVTEITPLEFFKLSGNLTEINGVGVSSEEIRTTKTHFIRGPEIFP